MKALFTLLPIIALCSCSQTTTVPAAFETPAAATAARAEAAKATGLQASQLLKLSPKQIAVLEKLPATQIAQLKGLKGPALASKLGEIAAPQLANIKTPALPSLSTPSVPSLKTPQLPSLKGLPSFDGFKGGRLTKPQALELAKLTGLEAPQFKKLSLPEIAKLRALKAPQLAELEGLKGAAFNKKLGTIQPPNLPWYKSPFSTQPAYAEIKKGMTQEEVSQALGRPSYKYAISGEETWVFENTNFIMKKVKSTAINMVPAIGPATTLIGGLRQGPAKASKAAVTFDSAGKVIEAKQGL